jgi:hypothetical protein
MKEEILNLIREELAKDIFTCISKRYDLLDKEGFEVYKDKIVYDLEGHKSLVVDLYKNEFSLDTYKFDMYKDPCPGLVSEKEEDVTDLCMALIGDLKDILGIFKCNK